MTPKERKVVLGLGNLLFSDEGFGIHAIQRMRTELAGRFPVEWIDGGVLGLSLLPLVEECSHLLVVDLVDKGYWGGTLIEMEGTEIPLYSGVKMSEHQIGFQEVLAMANFRGCYPRNLYLVGVQPADLNPGVNLSPAVEAILPAAVDRVRATLEEWFPA